MPVFSVVILTLNEEANLPRCLASVAGCDDIVVLDSGSTDRTAALARSAGARVVERRFDTFAGQRNYAQTAISFRHPWVFHLDADEQFTPELLAECRATPAADDLDGYYVAPRMLWCGQWVPHCTDFPAWQARFTRVSSFRFIDVGHGQREAPSMRMGYLRANYLHDLSAQGEAAWLEKHRRYAQAEAARMLSAAESVRLTELLSSDRLVRRRALKHFSAILPWRSFARFVYQYVLRGGCLDGSAGLAYCRLLARYEGFIGDELRRQRKGQS